MKVLCNAINFYWTLASDNHLGENVKRLFTQLAFFTNQMSVGKDHASRSLKYRAKAKLFNLTLAFFKFDHPRMHDLCKSKKHSLLFVGFMLLGY